MISNLIQYWQAKNGMRVYYVPRHEIPMLELHVVFDAGSSRDGNKYGLSQLTNIMINQGSKKHDANQIIFALEDIGAEITNTSDRDRSTFSLRSLTKPKLLKKAISILAEIIGNPTFRSQAFSLKRNLVLSAIKHQSLSPEAIAKNAFYEAVYNHHPYRYSVLGTAFSVRSLTTYDLKQFYNKYYVARNAAIILVGDIGYKQAVDIVDHLCMNLSTGETAEKIPLANIQLNKNEHHIQFPSEQTHILMGQVGINYNDANYFPIMLGNYILGGSPPTSRLFRQIRNNKGLVYSIISMVSILSARGTFSIILQTRNSEAKKAFQATRHVLDNFIKDGPTNTELMKEKKRISNQYLLTISSNHSIAEKLCAIAFYKLPLDYVDTYCEKINAVEKNQIKDAFQKHFQPDNLITIMVGDSENSVDV